MNSYQGGVPAMDYDFDVIFKYFFLLKRMSFQFFFVFQIFISFFSISRGWGPGGWASRKSAEFFQIKFTVWIAEFSKVLKNLRHLLFEKRIMMDQIWLNLDQILIKFWLECRLIFQFIFIWNSFTKIIKNPLEKSFKCNHASIHFQLKIGRKNHVKFIKNNAFFWNFCDFFQNEKKKSINFL